MTLVQNKRLLCPEYHIQEGIQSRAIEPLFNEGLNEDQK